MRLSKNVAEQTGDKTRGMSTYLLANARNVACENIRFSSLFAAGDVKMSSLAKSEEKRMFSQATRNDVT